MANLRESRRGGYEPDLPAECTFEEVATTHPLARWRIYACSTEPRSPLGHPGVEPVSRRLAELLTQARKHPNAIFVARAKALDYLKGDVPALVSRETFGRLFADFLAQALAAPEQDIDLDFLPSDD